MTILYLADTRFPIERANGVQTMATCHALAERGHDVHLFVRSDTVTPPRDPFAFYDLPVVPGLEVHYAPTANGARTRRIRYIAGALSFVSAHPEAVVYTRDLGVASFLLLVPGARRLRVIYEAHGIAAVVADEMPRLLGRAALVPSPAKLRRLDRRERRVWRKAAAYVTITQALADDLTTRYGPRQHVFVVPDAATPVDAANMASTPTSGLVGYAGHLYPWKGVDVLVRAIALRPHLHGLIVGGHPAEADRDRVERLARDLGVRERIEFTGLVPRGDVARHLARASILVLPNTQTETSARYTSPLKLFEYLGMSRPIVASDLPAIREVLTHGKTALLVPPDDPEALAGAFDRLTADPAFAASIARAAHDLSAEFSWARRAIRIESALDAAVRA